MPSLKLNCHRAYVIVKTDVEVISRCLLEIDEKATTALANLWKRSLSFAIGKLGQGVKVDTRVLRHP